jgi:isoquinoline 1-oxidoreductase beta subunit
MSNTIQRRNFLKSLGLAGIGLGIGIDGFSKTSSLVKVEPAFFSLEINPFIIIDNTGKITLVNSRPDMGQGSTQAVPSLLAEELEVSLDQVTIIQSDGRSKYGSQLSGGSSSVRGLWMPLRKAGAAARELLIKAAAETWKVPATECYAEAGKIIHKPSGKSLGYGQLADLAATFEIPKNPKLKDPKDFKILGKYNARLDVPDRVSGKAVYGIDVEIPGMVYAKMVHSPKIHETIVKIDDTEAKKVKGVLQVIKSERAMPHTRSEAVAVVASNYWAAIKGAKALKVEWKPSETSLNQNSADYFAKMYEEAKKPGINHEEKGDFDAVYNAGEKKLEAIYETPFLAHAPIEPENATVHVKEDGSVEIWAPVQGPDGTLAEVSGYLNIPADKIKVNVTLLGGAFGRKAYLDFVLEACDISKKINKPVKLIWSREDDISQGPYRPAMLSKMQGVIGKNGSPQALHHQAVGESILGQVFQGLQPTQADPWLGEELSQENHKYGFPVHKMSYSRVKTTIPIVWWRSVYASNFGWGQECFIDEMAHQAGKDPLAFRMGLLKDAPRFKGVLEMLAEKANWNQKLPEGQAKGLAIFRSFDSISAACVFVSKKDRSVKIDKVISVIDCGMFVNPDNVKAQTEGNIVMGLSAAVKGGITFENETCVQSNFHDYLILRNNEMPEIETYAVINEEKPGGVGEPGLPPIAPALGNAIFALTGKRIRKLPLNLDEV